MGLISAPQTMYPEDAYLLGVFLQSAWPDTLADGAPRVYIYTGWHDPYPSLSSPLQSKYHIRNHPTYGKPNTSRYAQGVRCADGASLTQEEHHSMSISFQVFCFYHSCAASVVYCSTPRSSEGEQVNAPHGVREVHAPHAPHARGAC